MFVSSGDKERDDIIRFEHGLYEVAVCQVIPLSSALECALLFFYNQDKPYCIEWDEL